MEIALNKFWHTLAMEQETLLIIEAAPLFGNPENVVLGFCVLNKYPRNLINETDPAQNKFTVKIEVKGNSN